MFHSFQFSARKISKVLCSVSIVGVILCIIAFYSSNNKSYHNNGVQHLERHLLEHADRRHDTGIDAIGDQSSSTVRYGKIASKSEGFLDLTRKVQRVGEIRQKIAPAEIDPPLDNVQTGTVRKNYPKFIATKTKIPEEIKPMVKKCNVKTDVLHMEGFSVRDNLLSKILHIVAFRKGLKVLPFDDVTNITDDVTSHVVQDLHPGNFSRRRFNIISKQFMMRDQGVYKYTHPNTTMVVSVGDPVEHFLTMLKTLKYKDQTIESTMHPGAELIKLLTKTLKSSKNSTAKISKLISPEQQDWLKNTIFTQLGLHKDIKFSLNLQELKSTIDLFFLKNRFDESLLRLKRKLCWDYKDIFYLNPPTDFLPKLSKNDSVALAGIESGLRQWSNLDYKLEEEVAKLSNMSAMERKDFEAELGQFRMTNRKVQTFCQSLNMSKTLPSDITQLKSWFQPQRHVQALTIKASRWHYVIRISQSDCVIMNMDPLILRNLNRVRALPFLCTNEFWKSAELIKSVYKLQTFDKNICSLLHLMKIYEQSNKVIH